MDRRAASMNHPPAFLSPHYTPDTSDIASPASSVPLASPPSSAPTLPSPVFRHVVDLESRRSLWTGTVGAAMLGGLVGAGHSIYSGYPLHRSVALSAFNCSFVAFTYLGTSLLLIERARLPSSSLSAELLAGSVSLGALLSLQSAAQGRITSSRDALRVGARAAVIGALCGCGVWAVKQSSLRWQHTTQQQQQRQSETAVKRLEQEATGGERGSASRGSESWLPAWSPVRVATEDDLAGAERRKEERRRRAHELQQMRREQRQQEQRQQEQERQLE